jgi:hypothetical protein
MSNPRSFMNLAKETLSRRSVDPRRGKDGCGY